MTIKAKENKKHETKKQGTFPLINAIYDFPLFPGRCELKKMVKVIRM